MIEKNCSFINGINKFRYRAAAIIIEYDCILLATNDKSDYFYSVGGAVHMGETAENAVIREVFEETNIKYEVDRLAFIEESFFIENNKNEHHIILYFIMKPKCIKQKINSFSCSSNSNNETIKWIPINELKNYTVYPKFFKEKLTTIKDSIKHIVTMDI